MNDHIQSAKKINQVGEQISSDPIKSKQFLIDVGILGHDGELSEQYYGDQVDVCKVVLDVCQRLGVRVIDSPKVCTDVFGDQYYQFGVHIMDLCHVGYDMIKLELCNILGGSVCIGYDCDHNKICIKLGN